ncbi:hypothetical protein [uncultured Sulfitobacter sp.]|uniref:hypothetical protein n=1 Tax=uncultured Sulfitobacter sp. TaxID=191468 RepID=UPI00260AA85F|nr:hypothetical protein [uncultured Sulfitobacter sp.]
MSKTVPDTPRRIVFSGDFLRPSIGGLRPTQHENIQWLYQLLKVPLEMATGLKAEIVHWDNNWLNHARLDAGTVEAIYRMMGHHHASIHAWPAVFGATTLPAPFEDLLLRWFGGSFVIGFELPPFLVAFLERHAIGFVDCSLSPVRFMDDVMFELSSHTPAITQALRPHAVPQDLIRLQAGIVSSNVAKVNPRPPRPNSLLVILQTRFDKVVIRDGRFTTVLDYLDTLKEIARDYDHLIIKEHPLEPQPETVAKLGRMLPDTVVSTENFYRLVSHPNVTGVTALSSSCVYEAGFFGKNGHYLLPDFTPATFTVGSEGIHIGDDVICPDFWRDILAGSPCPVTAKDGLRLAAKPNRFRQQLRAAWGYNEIDTDIAVGWAPKPA